MADATSNRRLWVWIPVVLVFVAGIAYLIFSGSRDRIVVRTATVQRGGIAMTLSTNGKVEPLVDFQAHAPAPTTVAQLSVHLGEQVSKGQPLLQLDSSETQLRIANAKNVLTINEQDRRNMQAGGTHDELLGEQADLLNAQTQLNEAKTGLTSLKALQAQGAASSNEVIAAQQRVADNEARLHQLQTRLHGRFGPGDFANNQSQIMRDQQELAAARNAIAAMDVTSPISGTVYTLPITRYDYVNPGQTLIGIADLHRLQVRAFFDEPEIGSLSAGEPVTITWDARPDRTWHGKVTQAPTTVINVGTRNVGECLISVDDADGQLLPNTNVTVEVTTMRHSDVLSMPREALHTEGAGDFVFRVVDGKLVRTPVNVGVVTLTHVEVTSGLKPGEVVALGATTDTNLQDGQLVRIQP